LSTLGLVISYGLEGPYFEFSNLGKVNKLHLYQHLTERLRGPHSLQWVSGLFPGFKAAGAWSWPPTSI